MTIPTPRELAVLALRRDDARLSDGDARRILDLTPPADLNALVARERDRAVKEEAERQHQVWLASDEGRAAQRAQALADEQRDRDELSGSAALLRQQGIPSADVERMLAETPDEVLYLSGARERPKQKRETGSSMVAHDSLVHRPPASTLPTTDELTAQLRAAGELPAESE